MMTIDIDTISGVPLTGAPNAARPTTSATTRKLRRKASVAAKASSAFATQSLHRSSNLFDLVAYRPLVAELLRLCERDLEHAARRQPGLVELVRLLLRPALQRLGPVDAHRVGELAHRGADRLQLLE